MKKNMRAAVMTLIIGILLSGCGNSVMNGKNIGDAIKASGKMKQTEISVADGTYAINVNSENFINLNGNVKIDESLNSKVIIEADDNVSEFFIAEIDESSNKIDIFVDSDKLFSDVNVNIIIGVPVNNIAISGTYNLEYSNAVLDSLKMNLSGSCSGMISGSFTDVKVELSGSSDLSLSGSTNTLSLTSQGSSKVNTMDLSSETVSVKASGSSIINVNAEKKLDVNASGSCTISYTGNPDITKDLSGSAVIKNK